jgi:hypothetical protein
MWNLGLLRICIQDLGEDQASHWRYAESRASGQGSELRPDLLQYYHAHGLE